MTLLGEFLVLTAFSALVLPLGEPSAGLGFPPSAAPIWTGPEPFVNAV